MSILDFWLGNNKEIVAMFVNTELAESFIINSI